MSPKLQKRHEFKDSPTIVLHLRSLFDNQISVDGHEMSKTLIWIYDGRRNFSRGSCAQDVEHIKRLSTLGCPLGHKLKR